MASVRTGRVSEDDAAGGRQHDQPAALRIDTEVLAALTERTAAGDDPPVIERWLDCWRP